MFKYKKTIYLALIIILICVLTYIKNNNYIFIYINPDNNTTVYPYISKASKEINSILDNSINTLKSYTTEAKIVYGNGYGSGFLKNNHTASDYDYGAGIYLGTYKYDGKNAYTIAEQIIKISTLYQSNLYSLVKNFSSEFYIQRLPAERVIGINEEANIDAKLIAKSIDEALKGKPYKMQIDNEIFFLLPNEVVLPNYNYVKLYNKDISYFNGYRKMLRELTVTIDYYIDILDTRTNKIHKISLISETAHGKRLYQPEFKYFVPNAYTSMKSFKHVKDIMPSLDDEKYFETRMINYYHHYTLNKYGNSKKSGSPLKSVKRLLQCTDIIAPILPDNIVEEIHKNVYEILESKTIALINDYYIANGILYNVTKSSSFYKDLEKDNQVSKLISDMELILTDMINDKNLSYKELKPLFDYQNLINKNKNNLNDLQPMLKEKFYPTVQYMEELMAKNIPDYSKIQVYTTYLNKVLETAGIYNIKFYKDRPNHIYVFKDNFTKHIKLTDFNKLDIINGSYTRIYNENTVFEFLDPKEFYGDTRDLNYGWIRYNPTKLQNAVYEEMKKQIIKDKRRYHLRIKAGLIRQNY